MFTKLIELIKEYPYLEEAFQEKIREGFSVTNITSTAVSPDEVDFISIEIRMENQNKEKIVIVYTEGFVNSITINQIPRATEEIHPNLVLNKDLIYNKTFKSKTFGGYDVDEVDQFLDLLIKDYTFIEDGLVKENIVLKKEVESLRDK
ncbi:DivIVA domain-containing protein [Paenisporosarcina macmurdoensis]|uniref:DivIVA domain-containing protein n=1 Tax=Paenisporosarcina macmurdoensis TaxID=212659 RepID=A0ABW1LAL2_9BACL